LFVTAADTLVLRGLLPANQVPRYFVLLRGKAATVLVHIVHYALGQGAYATWLARKTGVSVARVTGLLIYIMAAELGSICVYASAVMALGRPNVPSMVQLFPAGVALGSIAALLLLPFARRPLERFVVAHPWTHMSRARAVAQLCARLPQHTVTSLGTWFAAQVFGLYIPLWVMLSYVPVILIVGSLPVNIAGFGAVQAAWLLLSPWAKPEQILAFSMVWQMVSCFALVLRGLPFLRGALSDIRQGVTPSPAVDPKAPSEARPRSASPPSALPARRLVD
jgi:hypothetical protein